ncbi:MAG: hypothetical protein GEU95_14750 [Rhizobiales bacterium]|nr:hypothetical protein [Hyphomicrobiales bacterium]
MAEQSPMRDMFLVAQTLIVLVMLSPVPSSAEGREVRIVNETGYGIAFIGVNAPGDKRWSKNRVTSVIRNGTSAQVSLVEDGHCRRDIRIAWDRKKFAPKVLKDVDLCSLRILTLHYNQATEALSYEKR